MKTSSVAEQMHSSSLQKDSARESTLGVVIPAFNEESTVAKVITSLLLLDCVHAVIVVDDGSSDSTHSRLKDEFGLNPRVTILQHEFNLGKGHAIRSGIQNANTSHLLIQDADLEYSPSDISRLWLEATRDDPADVVFGSRYLEDRSIRRGRFLLQSGVRLLNLAVWLLYGRKLTDEATCYKLFRKSDLLAMNLECERFEFCPEVTAKSIRMGLQIVEIPVSYKPRSKKAGKKLRLIDGYYAIRELLRLRNWNAK